ncbi:hypothetical protein HK100_010091 [Physocladia obscura]|uniref:Hydantoinase B/oxoprolinase domain-containing protein n=1 Tax=Physocladia obscura TaxID=109957 RepID=A0AAD5X739_9FUNG|nr:hypothetical protein HK100_010091 [Physocladia obscura]
MTNTRITDPEILERRYPVLLRQFGLRQGSGGDGLHRGGDGVIRELEFLETLNVSILSERRVFQPYGMNGGDPGQSGINLLQRKGQTQAVNFGGKNATIVHNGDLITIMTPGGGGYGAAVVKPAPAAKGKRKAVAVSPAATRVTPKRAAKVSRLGGGSLGALEAAQLDF